MTYMHIKVLKYVDFSKNKLGEKLRNSFLTVILNIWLGTNIALSITREYYLLITVNIETTYMQMLILRKSINKELMWPAMI